MVEELLYGNTRCYLVNKILMIDTNWAGSLQQLFRCIKEKNIVFKDIQYLIITHFHPDHMGIAQNLIELGITLIVFDVQSAFVHEADAIFFKERHTPFKVIDDTKIVYLNCAESRTFLQSLGITGEVVYTPGHSDDSVSIIIDDECAIVGDLYPLKTVKGYNDKRLEASWNRLLAKDVKKVYYGHAPYDIIKEIKCVDEI